MLNPSEKQIFNIIGGKTYGKRMGLVFLQDLFLRYVSKLPKTIVIIK